jgi:antitoxin HicB
MQTFRFLARFEPGDEGGLVVTFPDVPEAITQGVDEADAQAQACEALRLALLTYPLRGLPFPSPAAKGDDLVPIMVEQECEA